jgi:hypothetical protein
VTVPNIPAGAAADIWLKVADPAHNNSRYFGPFVVTLGGGVIVPPNLPMGNVPLLIPVDAPEPSPLVLFGCAGVLGWLFSFRVRKGTGARLLTDARRSRCIGGSYAHSAQSGIAPA